ncbi:MAG: ATP-binding protein [Candidatus Krumholzibacteriia bacterium]
MSLSAPRQRPPLWPVLLLLLAASAARAQAPATGDDVRDWATAGEAALADGGAQLRARVDSALTALDARADALVQAAGDSLTRDGASFAFLERTIGARPQLLDLPLGAQLLDGDEPLAWVGRPVPLDEQAPPAGRAGLALRSFGVYRFLSLRRPLGGSGLDLLLDLPLAERLPGAHGGLPVLLAPPPGLALELLPTLAASAADSASAGPVWRDEQPVRGTTLLGLSRSWVLAQGGRALLELRLQGPSAQDFERVRDAARRRWLGAGAALLVLVGGLWLRARLRRGRPEGLPLVARALVIGGWALLLRLALRWGGLPGSLLDGEFWSPRDFALDVPGRLLDSPGEFLLSALAALGVLLLVLRPYLHPEDERADDEPAAPAHSASPLLGLFAVLAPLAAVLVTGAFARLVYANSTGSLLGATGLDRPAVLGFDLALFFAAIFLLSLLLVPANFAWRRLALGRAARLVASLPLLALAAWLGGLETALALLLLFPVAWGFRRAAARLTGLLFHVVFVILAVTLIVDGAREHARRDLRADLAPAAAEATGVSFWQPQQVEETLLTLGREPALRRDLALAEGSGAWLALAAWQSAGLDALGERGALELFDARGRLRGRYQQGVELPLPVGRAAMAPDRSDLSVAVQSAAAEAGPDSLPLVSGEVALSNGPGHPLGTLVLRLRAERAPPSFPATATLPQRLLAASLRLFLYLAALFVLLLLDLLFSRVELVRRTLPPLVGPRGLGFQHRLLGAFLLVALLPVVLTGLIAGRQIRAQQDAASLRASLERVRAARRSLENRVRQDARDLAASEYVRNFVVPDFPPTVRDIGSLEHNRIMIFDGDGALLLDESLRNWSPAQSDSFLAVLPPGRVVYEREGRRVHAGLLLPMELWHRERRVSFSVYYRLALDGGLLDDLGEVVGGELNLYAAGALLHSGRPALFGLGYQSPMLDPSTVAAMAAGADQHQDLDRAADLRFGRATLPLDDALGSPVALLSSLDVAGLDAPAGGLQQSSSLVFSMIALLLVLALGLGGFLAGRVFLPIRRLQLAVRRLSAGDLGARLPAGGADEIGELMSSFNRMAEGLESTRGALEHRQRFLENVLENVASGVLAFDAAGRLVSANGAARRLLALGDEPVDGLALDVLAGLPPAGLDRGALFRHLIEHPDGLRGPACELRLEHPEGARTLRMADADPSGERVLVFEDVTELIRSQKLAAWSEMARQVAHEIKNPLTPIKLSAQMVERAWRDGRDDFASILDESLSSIAEQVEILRNIASEFSQFGRRQALTAERVDAAALLREILAPYRDALDVDWQGPASLPVRADREALRKVLLNLVENAREAMEGAGRLEVSLAAEDAQGLAGVLLRDFGTGIPGEALDRLFEPYFSTKTRGTGLGLAISAQLVEEMGGRLRLENHPAGGAVARLELPGA